ncbi:unnamed protein product, partial [Pocillopora meandrina]
IHAIKKTALLSKPLKTLLLSLAASDVGVGLLAQPLHISILVGWLNQKRIDCISYKRLMACGQVLSCSSSSQISRACDSQARHCSGDINMAIEGLQIQEAQQGVQNGDLSNFLKLRKSALGTFFVCIVFLICYLPCYILSFLLLTHFVSPISFYEARLYVMTLFFLNSSLDPVIYCWKMGPIRRTLMDIMRGIVNRFRE